MLQFSLGVCLFLHKASMLKNNHRDKIICSLSYRCIKCNLNRGANCYCLEDHEPISWFGIILSKVGGYLRQKIKEDLCIFLLGLPSLDLCFSTMQNKTLSSCLTLYPQVCIKTQ